MKKFNSHHLIAKCLLMVSMSGVSLFSSAQDYYVSSQAGADTNIGSKTKPFASLKKINKFILKPGDNVFLKAGDKFKGSLQLINESGSAKQPINISTYGDSDERAYIDAAGELAGLEIKNSSHINVSNLDIEADGGKARQVEDIKTPQPMRLGVLIYIAKRYNKTFGHITLDNLKIHDIFHYDFGKVDRAGDVNTQNGTQAYGYGIHLFNRGNGPKTLLTDITIKNSEIYDVAHTGIKATAHNPRLQTSPYPILKKLINNITLENNHLHDIGGPGIMFGGVDGSLVTNNVTNRTGSSSDFDSGMYDARKWGRGSGMWTWNANDVLVEHNEFKNAVGPADSAGFHIDFHCSNIVIQHNFSMNNEGAFIEILGNNRNNSYRYNVSVNDGYRVKGDKDRPYGKATHDGKTLWFSGFVGMKGKKVNPNIAPVNNYIYNNTIYVDHAAQVAAHQDTEGAVIANNIFYFKQGSYYLPEKRYQLVNGKNTTKNFTMTNNLFLQATDWPNVGVMENNNPIIGDPKFLNAGGNKVSDYQPTNNDLIANKGIAITPLPSSNGLQGNTRSGGLQVKEDILGNALNGQIHIGAIAPINKDVNNML
ncbi:right-handed parallel beta-helix repeat-containing protein [Thalassotalea crassostreae]|uniref:right-handed parallel beta-helix repeat-containing protein n=1 Tax=Thalassotalea crassostreae TaxID=1763536 RepID=UPI0009ED67CA|nr:right-handed parallel beta-helix repeat-containing protein [Thalassotalea crassostreae]